MMKKFIPIINCGYEAGQTPMVWKENPIYFDTEADCECWIDEHYEYFAPVESGGGIYASETEIPYTFPVSEKEKDKKKKFGVECIMTYSGYCEVEADSEHDALDYVKEHLAHEYGDDFPDEGQFGVVYFGFCDAVVDSVYEV